MERRGPRVAVLLTSSRFVATMDSSSLVDPQEVRRSLESAERLLGCFQKALGHELPNQLVAVQGLVYLLQEEEGARLGAEGRATLERLAAVVKRTHLLVRELADVGRSVRRAPAAGAARLHEAVAEVVAEVKQLSPGQRIEYHVADPGVPLPVPEAGLRQVLGCLLRHAAGRATGRPLTVEVGARPTPAGVEIWLAEDGPPFAPAERQQLFEPFAGADPRLGLFLASLLVGVWGGTLDAATVPGGGNRFTIALRNSG
jgi:signal transduction histidine kinase